ncbi:transposable element Tcb2 transposase [Trichonephila clavipes]|nr:transposable element Tcb2 transposase [Trichonephila clavipes]
MSSRHHIDDFMRGRIIGKIEEGRKITDVAREFDIAHSVVSRLWKSFKTTGMCSRRPGGGRVRSTAPAEDRYIVLSAKRNRRTTAQQVANQFLAASGKQISQKTVARRLRGGGLYARRPVVCVPLTRQHRTAHLQWCREHHNWTEQDWACVLFSDESRFSLSSDCRRQLIWRESGTAYRPENIQEKDRYPTCSIMVWADIMINGRTRLHVVANGTMTGQRYIDEVLLPHVRLYRGAVGDKLVFMDDNATCHRTLAVQDCLDSEGIHQLVWPARSPDLNPIENVWDALGRQVASRNYPPTNKNPLIRALTEEWDKLPQQLLDNVVQRFPSHIIREAKPHTICKTISEFALEYRTCRERVQQQIEKAAALKERNKTRGKMITETEKFRAPTKEQREDQQLRQILGESDAEEAKMTQWGSMVNLRGRPKSNLGGTLSRPNSVMMLDRCGGYITPYESTTDIDDEILESLVKTATAQPNRTEPRTRKKARYADRKSLRRTLKGGLDLGDGIGT